MRALEMLMVACSAAIVIAALAAAWTTARRLAVDDPGVRRGAQTEV